MAKPMLIPMHDTDGQTFTWRVERSPKDHRIGAGWTFTDHEGYERWGGTNWAELRDRFDGVAQNYGFTHKLS